MDDVSAPLLLHPLVRWLGRRCLRWFYRERCVLGRDNIPAIGPVLLIGNHPNDLPDILLGYLSTSRPVRYVGTISGAASPIARATYRGLGVIPVTRIRDARKQRELGVNAANNDAAFRSVSTALKAGAMVAVFPEGGVTDEPFMGPFRGGVSKMALDCAESGAKTAIRFVPIGLHYDAPRTPRTDTTVVIGASFDLDDWLHTYHNSSSLSSAAAPSAAHRAQTLVAIALRNRMREALLTVTRNAATWEQAQARDRLAALIGALNSSSDTSPLASAAQEQHACAHFLRHPTVDAPTGDEKATVRVTDNPMDAARDNVIRMANALSAAVIRAGGRPESPRDCARVLHATGVLSVSPNWPPSFVTLLSAPIALFGLALHAPVLAFVWRHAQHIAADRAELVGKAFAPGLYFVFLWYAVLGLAFATTLYVTAASAWWAAPAVMLLPRLGDVAVWWHDALSAWRLRARVTRWSDADRAEVRAAADALHKAWATERTRARPGGDR